MVKTRKQVIKEYPQGINKLEIGSGENPEAGYVHLDIQPDLPDLDILGDAKNLPIPENFVTEDVRAVHIMEHFCHPEYAGKELIEKYGTTMDVVNEAYRVLKPGGKFRIVTPDFDKLAESVTKKRISYYHLQRWTVGGHLNEYDVHHWLWTKQDAVNWFSQAGFKNLRDWNPTRGWRGLFLDWNTKDKPNNKPWHELEWYHWLFFEGTK